MNIFVHKILWLQELGDQALDLLELFFCALLMALLAVFRGGHSLHGVKGLGEYQCIAVAAGQRNTLNGIIRGIQQFPRLGNTEGGKELLG